MIEGINIDDLQDAAQLTPQYTRLFIGITQIDKLIKQVVTDTVESNADNPSAYYVKTELIDMDYALYLFNAEQDATVGTRWRIDMFLDKCKDKTIEFDVQTKVVRMLKKFGSKIKGGVTHWI